ncbi:hypothetical protein BD413DRAFT_637158 [Trametes elegans]|nr:hypothetical protein BD413DRAFT_637158 [Trametes elegans]
MYVPVLSNLGQHLYPRLGGGGRGGGGGGGGGRGALGEASPALEGALEGYSGSSSGGRGSSVPVSGSTNGRSSATSYGSGSTKVSSIPAGQPFAGRQSGGGTRGNVFGNQAYGSGYPGLASGSVAGRGFPFVFWPLVWGGGLGYGAAYLHDHEYGDPKNESRPGGPLTQGSVVSSSTNTTLHIVADNSTVTSLLSSIKANCTLASNSSTQGVSFSGSATDPKPEQAIQYYRASSVVLTLDGYNNTNALSNDTSLPPIPLPSNIDTTLVNCVNQTIGAAVPLFDDSGALQLAVPKMGLLGLAYVVWCLTYFL